MFLKIRYILEYVLFNALLFFVKFAGTTVLKIFISIMFVVLFPFLYKKIFFRYRLARYNLSIIGEKNPSKIKVFLAVLRYIESFALLTVYGASLLKTHKKFNLIEQGGEIIENLQKQGKGFIVVSFHYGNWEVFPTYLKHRFNINNYFIYKEQRNQIIDNKIKETRAGLEGVGPLKKGAKDIASIVEITKRGEVVDILIDQIQNIGSEPINLFGKNVKIGFTIQKLAAKHNIILVPTFCFIDKSISKSRYVMKFHEPIEFDNLEKGEVVPAAIKATQQIADIAMSHIKKDPYQWFCLFYRIFGDIPSDFQ